MSSGRVSVSCNVKIAGFLSPKAAVAECASIVEFLHHCWPPNKFSRDFEGMENNFSSNKKLICRKVDVFYSLQNQKYSISNTKIQLFSSNERFSLVAKVLVCVS